MSDGDYKIVVFARVAGIAAALIFGVAACDAVSTVTDVDTEAQAAFNVGFTVIDLPDLANPTGAPLTVAVWYPTAESPSRHVYGGPTSGSVAVDAPPLVEAGRFPLLVFSHGYGGSGIGSVFFTEPLAAKGWIVVAPDHRDRHSAVRIRGGQVENFDSDGLAAYAREITNSGPEDRAPYLYRLDEMELALEGVLDSPLFAPAIDETRIAVGGHSFGGYTSLGLSGTIAERHDSRIDAVLLFSTGAGGYLYTEAELARVTVPTMLYMGERERNQLRGSATMETLAAKIFDHVARPKYFAEVRGGTHFSFNNRFSYGLSSRLLSGTDEQFDVIRRYSIAFLERHVAGRPDLDNVLAVQDVGLSRYVAVLD